MAALKTFVRMPRYRPVKMNLFEHDRAGVWQLTLVADGPSSKMTEGLPIQVTISREFPGENLGGLDQEEWTACS